MAYTDKEELTARYGDEIAQLIDRDNSGSEDTDALDSVINDADSIIDGYLAGRYATPLKKVPQQVIEIASEITRYKLWDDKAPEEVRKRYEDAMKRLRDIATGLITLTIDKVPLATAGNSVAYTERERTFTDCTLKGFVGQ